MILFEKFNFYQCKIFDQGITAQVQDETNAILFIRFNSKRDLVHI